MLIVSGDKIFSAAIREYLEDLHIDKSTLDRCVIVDLDSAAPQNGAITFSRDKYKSPDLTRPFLMTDLAELLRKRFSDSFEMATKKSDDAEFVLTSDGVSYRGSFVPLTPRERDMLGLLLSRRGDAISREEMFTSLWGGETADSNVVDVYIRYLRKKLDFHFGERIIYTRRGMGYYIK